MIRICHFADAHWRGIARHAEYNKAFELLFEELKALKPDIIINAGDFFHTKTQGITPEIIDRLVWAFTGLANISLTYHILGNHDVALNNLTRENIISPIVNAIKNPNCVLLQDSGTYYIPNTNIALANFSCFDPDWSKVKKDQNAINIALYHGSISGVKVNDSTWVLKDGEQNVEFFNGFDFAFLGDIHKQQYLSYRKDKHGVEKPWIGYPGSLIQQNYGESTKKGYLVWDIRDKDDWDVEWRQLKNYSPFLTVPWKGSSRETISNIKENLGGIIPTARYRISSSISIPQIQAKQVVKELKEDFHASEVVFKTDIATKVDSFTSGGVKISKKSLTQDPEMVFNLYKDYILANASNHRVEDGDFESVSEIITKYLSNLNKNTEIAGSRNAMWSIREFKFDNLFGYGENNVINFDSLESLVGILGPNRSGKSSLIGALIYTLFNTTDRGAIKTAYIINENKTYCSGTARINVAGTEYVIERRSEKSKYNPGASNSSVNLWRVETFVDGSGRQLQKKVSANGITRDETDEIIRGLIGNVEDFLLTTISSQGNLNRFIDNKATKRKEILNRFLELDVFDKLYLLAKDDCSKLDSASRKYTIIEWSKLITKTEGDIQKLDQEIKKLKEKIEPLNLKRDELKLWIKTNQKEAEGVDKKTVRNIQQYIESLEKAKKDIHESIKNNKQQLSKVKITKRLLESKIKKIDKVTLQQKIVELESFRKSFGELKSTLDLESSALNTQKEAIKKLDVIPCGDQYPSCHFIRDAHEAKQTINNQKQMVVELTKKYESLQKTIDSFTKQGIQEKISEFDSFVFQNKLADSNIEKLELSLVHDAAKLDKTNDDIRALKAKLQKAKKTLALQVSSGYTKRVDKLEKIEKTINELNDDYHQIVLKLGGKNEALNKLQQEQQEGTDLIKKLRIYDNIQAAFSKNGIPAMVLKTQLPMINTELSKVLSGLVDFSVTLETDLSSNSMDVYFSDFRGLRLIELCSGMEKTMTSMALRVALGNLSSLSRPDFLVLDESFGALDENNLQKGIEMLTLFRDYFKTIFVISHESAIKESTDQIIEIKFDGQTSKVVID